MHESRSRQCECRWHSMPYFWRMTGRGSVLHVTTSLNIMYGTGLMFLGPTMRMNYKRWLILELLLRGSYVRTAKVHLWSLGLAKKTVPLSRSHAIFLQIFPYQFDSDLAEAAVWIGLWIVG